MVRRLSPWRVYAVAGYICDGHGGISLSSQWRERLNYFNLETFKASDLESGFGAFRKHRDNPNRPELPLSEREKNLIKEIKTSFVALLCEIGCIDGIGTSVSLREYYGFRHENPELAKRIPPPYSLCGQLTLMLAGMVANKADEYSTPDSQVALKPIFDVQEEHSGRFEESFNEFRRVNPKYARCILPPSYEDENDYRILQAADCLAYEMRRDFNRRLMHPDRPQPRKAWERLKMKL